MMASIFEVYDIVDRLPDHTMAVTVPRPPGYHPLGEENPYAWVQKVSIKACDAGPLHSKRIVLKDSICLSGVPMSCGGDVPRRLCPECRCGCRDAHPRCRRRDHSAEIARRQSRPFPRLRRAIERERKG
jgi:hypothetical protein